MNWRGGWKTTMGMVRVHRLIGISHLTVHLVRRYDGAVDDRASVSMAELRDAVALDRRRYSPLWLTMTAPAIVRGMVEQIGP